MVARLKEKINTVLFVDDDPQSLLIGKHLVNYGFNFKVTSKPEEALELVSNNNLDLVLVDLDMEPIDGVELTKMIKKINPNIPVVVFSSHLRELSWSRRIERVKYQFEDFIEKPFPTLDANIQAFCKRLGKVIDKHAGDDPKFKSQPKTPPTIDPFSIGFESYLALDINETIKLRQRAWEMKKDWFLREVEKRDLDWVVLCGDEEVKTSLSGDPMPTEDQLIAYGEQYDRIPHLFIRPPIIEEFAWAGIGKIKRSQQDDYYPTFSCSIEYPAGGPQQNLIGDFDTGSIITILSSDTVPLGKIGPLNRSEHLGEVYWYTSKWIKFVLQDDNYTASTSLPVYVVQDWQKKTNPFLKVNPHRLALFGRDLLNAFKLRVTLDSSQRKTFIELAGSPQVPASAQGGAPPGG